MSKIVVTVTGPSASGKTEIVNRLCAEYNFQKLVSITTRPPRDGEVEGVEYYFVTEGEFFEQKNSGNLVQEVCFNGKFYATTSDEIDRVFSSGKTPIVIVEPGGVDQFTSVGNRLGFEIFSLFVHAPYETLKKRFNKRLAGIEPTQYDMDRLVAIKKESSTWHDLQDWSMKAGNGGDDVSDVQWLANNVNEAVTNFRKVNE